LLFLTKPIFIVLVIFPFLDVFSDLLFIISAEFFTDFIWYICVFFYLLPCMHFIYEMIAVESLIGRSACFKFPLQGNLWWLSSKDGLPMISGEHPNFIKDSWEDLIKITFVVIPTWILLCMFQLCTWILFFFWTVIFDPMFFFWTGVGMFFYQTKLLAFVPFWNMWVRRWTGSDNHIKKGLVSVQMLNKSVLTELIFESMPQIIIQVVNGILMKTLTLVGIFSVSMSALFIVNGIYKFLFFLYCKKVTFDKIPNGIDIPSELRSEENSIKIIYKESTVVPEPPKYVVVDYSDSPGETAPFPVENIRYCRDGSSK